MGAPRAQTHLVDEEHAGHNLGLALLPPVADLGVDLVAQLRLDLARVACALASSVAAHANVRRESRRTGKEGQEALGP